MTAVDDYYKSLAEDATPPPSSVDESRLSLDATLAAILAEQKRRKDEAKKSADVLRLIAEGRPGKQRRGSEASQKLLATLPIDESKVTEELRPKINQVAGGEQAEKGRLAVVMQRQRLAMQEQEKKASEGNVAGLAEKKQVAAAAGASYVAFEQPKGPLMVPENKTANGQTLAGQKVAPATNEKVALDQAKPQENKMANGKPLAGQKSPPADGAKAAVDGPKQLVPAQDNKTTNGQAVVGQKAPLATGAKAAAVEGAKPSIPTQANGTANGQALAGQKAPPATQDNKMPNGKALVTLVAQKAGSAKPMIGGKAAKAEKPKKVKPVKQPKPPKAPKTPKVTTPKPGANSATAKSPMKSAMKQPGGKVPNKAANKGGGGGCIIM